MHRGFREHIAGESLSSVSEILVAYNLGETKHHFPRESIVDFIFDPFFVRSRRFPLYFVFSISLKLDSDFTGTCIGKR